jgi:Zn-dependent protease
MAEELPPSDSPGPLPPPVTPPPVIPPEGGGGRKLKRAWGPLAVLAAILAKFKVFLIPAIKFLPVLIKTGGTMLLSFGLYALRWPWPYALGFVILIFVHECGHLLVAKRLGLKVGAPMFIPFVGALIMLKETPRNAGWKRRWALAGRCSAAWARRSVM